MKLSKETVRLYLQQLSHEERDNLLGEFKSTEDKRSSPDVNLSRRLLLDNKQGECPHCGHPKYVKYGTDKGAQRYKCKSCKRNFTEYTGTWMAGIHKKDKLDGYIKLMFDEKSLDKIKEELGVNKKTAFDWRHKVLASLENIENESFTGITESDETFLRFSEKGKRTLSREGKKRGTKPKSKGISNEQVAVITTADRAGHQAWSVATLGRIRKSDIENSIGGRISDKTILCSDGHVSYKGFAIDKCIEHHVLRADLKQRVKKGKYHIQHVNSMHNRAKRWINGIFWGVATKYLQQYLNWFRVKERMKHLKQTVTQILEQTVNDIQTHARYKTINNRYENMISSQ